MERLTIAPFGWLPARRRIDPAAQRRRRFLTIAVLLSVCAHLLGALFIVFMPRFLPLGRPRKAEPQEQGTIELLMVEQKGAQPAQPDARKPVPARPAKPEPPKVEAAKPEAAKPEAAKPEAEKPEKPEPEGRIDTPSEPDAKPVPPLPDAQQGEVAPPPPANPDPPKPAPPQPIAPQPVVPQPAQPQPVQPPPPPKPAEAQPVPPRPQQAPVFDLAGTESESNAVVMGGHVLPASPDDKFRNRPPAYPADAQMHNQHGTVVILIHVGANGLTAGADVEQSSGVTSLDQAALNAVMKWRFHPAMKDGRTVPFDFPFQFVFEPY